MSASPASAPQTMAFRPDGPSPALDRRLAEPVGGRLDAEPDILAPNPAANDLDLVVADRRTLPQSTWLGIIIR
jgi:hypothetical protein